MAWMNSKRSLAYTQLESRACNRAGQIVDGAPRCGRSYQNPRRLASVNTLFQVLEMFVGMAGVAECDQVHLRIVAALTSHPFVVYF